MRQRGLRLQDGGDGKSEKAEQQCSARYARSAYSVVGAAPIVLRLLFVHRADPLSTWPISINIRRHSTAVNPLPALLGPSAAIPRLTSTVVIAP